MMPQDVRAGAGRAKERHLPFPQWKMEKGGPEFEFLPYKEVLCTPAE